MSPVEVGNLIPGRRLGDGASAEVFEIEGEEYRPFVLKVAHPDCAATLAHEARTLALCGGTFAPRLLGVGRNSSRGALTLVLERAAGVGLDRLLEGESDRVALAQIVLLKGAEALCQLHRWGRSHGDFKPANVFVSQDAESKLSLIDFGLSSAGERVHGGTPRYLPEALLRGAAIAPRLADSYAWAMTVCEVLLPDAWSAGATPMELLSLLPSEKARLLRPYLEGPLEQAPSLTWVLDEATEVGSLGRAQRSRDAVRREYLGTRLSELESSHIDDWDLPSGNAGSYLDEALRLLSSIDEVLRQERRARGARFSDLRLHDRRRFLGRLIGPWATSWALPSCSDGELVEALETLMGEQPAQRISFAALLEALRGDAPIAGDEESIGDPVTWALKLTERPVSRQLLIEISGAEDAPRALRLEAARVARQAGWVELGLQILEGLDEPEAALSRARLHHRGDRAGEAEQICRRLQTALAQSASESVDARAYLARRKLDAGDISAALGLLPKASKSAAVEEVRALSLLMQGDGDAALAAVAQGEAYARDAEAAARLEGVRGMVLHRQGEPLASLKSFARACELSSRSGATLEEATYATGWAAAATDAGNLTAALEASERSEQLFEALGKPGQTARAILSRAVVLSSLGAIRELEVAIRRGRSLCAETGDRLCEAYLEFCWADAAEEPGQRQAAARRGAELVQEGLEDDRLRASSRLLSTGQKPEPGAEEWAERSGSREARLEWYRARAEALEKVSSHSTSDQTRQEAESVIAALVGLSAGAPLLAAGPAFVAGAHLSLRIGQAEDASRLLSSARVVADRFSLNIPEEHRARAVELPWLQQAKGSKLSGESGHAQLSDVESLLRALSQRRGFRGLLDHILDLLLMWTGVQRGLLLLRAPGGKLVVRAGRNLNKNDLSPEQRQLSTSMAERALAEGRPVVAVDAVNDISAIHRSVHALNLRSVLAVPLSARGEVLGVAYLDDRVRRGAFGERELSWVGLIGTVAALAIADERDRLQLERALRKAKRAQKRLSGELTHREAELELAERELSRMKGTRQLRGDYSHIVGRSHAMTTLLQLVDRVAQSDIPALIQGESGTGKELIARAVASAGARKDRAFVAENCSAVPETLLESTLFGHQKGAFTGATRNQAGLFELAHRGTLFLDEIGDMSLPMQTKLLRVLQEGEVRALGAERARKVDVRVIVATHKDLKALVEKGEFREDLYYRLNVVTLQLPALRERQEDIAQLVGHFLEKYSSGEPRTLSQAALHRLSNFSWPGNVRQLENEVRRMLVLGGTELTAADLSPEVLNGSSDLPEATTLREKVDALERRLLVDALEEARGNRTRAAAALGLSRFGLQKMAQRLKIQLPKNPPKAGRIKARGLDETQ